MKVSEILLRFARVKLYCPFVLPAKVSPDYFPVARGGRRGKKEKCKREKRGPSTEVV